MEVRKRFKAQHHGGIMYCYYHPDRPSTAQCAVCGKYLCTECVIVKEGRNFCKDCMKVGTVDVKVQKILFPALLCSVVTTFVIMLSVQFLGLAFCLWVPVCGGLAVYVVKRFQSIKGKISFGKAALTGGLTGLVAGALLLGMLFLVRGVVNTALEQAMNQPEVQEALRSTGLAAGDLLTLVLVILVLIVTIGFALLGALGGIIGNEISK